MMEALTAIGKTIAEHWLEWTGGLLLFLAGRWVGRIRAQRAWESRDFLDRLMLSLNGLGAAPDGRPRLEIRTLAECDLRQVLLNDVAVRKVRAAAAAVTEADPILPIAAEDRWFILNAILNEVAERFSGGSLAKDLGLPVVSHAYLIALTNEIAGEVRTHKVRAMVMRKDHLVSGRFEGDVALEKEHHRTRLKTLAVLRRAYETTPDQFLELQLALPAPRT